MPPKPALPAPCPACLQSGQCSVFMGVPTMYNYLLAHYDTMTPEQQAQVLCVGGMADVRALICVWGGHTWLEGGRGGAEGACLLACWLAAGWGPHVGCWVLGKAHATATCATAIHATVVCATAILPCCSIYGCSMLR